MLKFRYFTKLANISILKAFSYNMRSPSKRTLILMEAKPYLPPNIYGVSTFWLNTTPNDMKP